MRLFLLLLSIFVLCSCGALQVLPLTIPAKPVYVVAGRDGAVGYGHTTISLVNRGNWQIMGNRNLTTSYIESGTHTASDIWLGLAGDTNEDKYIVSKISYDLAHQTDYITCMEPRAIHRYHDSLIVLCQDRGFVAVAMRIRMSDGKVLAQRELTTQWGDMFFDNSFLIGDEVVIQGGSHSAPADSPPELQVLDASTLAQKRLIPNQALVGIAEAIVQGDTVYILNTISDYSESAHLPFADIYTFHAGDAQFTPMPPVARAPQQGVIVDNTLYTLHNTWPAQKQLDMTKIFIYKTDLTTWQTTHWEYDYATWNHISDIAAIDGHIMLANYWREQPDDEGLYELNPQTGTLTQRVAIRGASLVIDTGAE